MIDIAFMEYLPLFALLAALGCLAGFLAGLLGIGGGTVLVPGFLYIFTALGYDSHFIMHLAVGTALAVIIATGSSSSYAHYKRGSIDWRSFMLLAPALIIGVAIGSASAKYMSGLHLQLTFAIILFLISLQMAFGDKIKLSALQKYKPFRSDKVTFGAGTLIGAVSTVMGIGGAVMNVPVMVNRGLVMQKAVGTGAILGLAVALPGAVGFTVIGLLNSADIPAGALPSFSFGFVNILGWVAVVPFTTLCAPLGVAMAHKINPSFLRRLFAFFMMILALNMAAEIWL